MKCELCRDVIPKDEGYQKWHFTCHNPPNPWNVCLKCYDEIRTKEKLNEDRQDN